MNVPRKRRPSVEDLAKDPNFLTLAKAPSTNDKLNISSMAHATRYRIRELPKYELPEESLDERTAYRLVMDEMLLDGNPTLNLATFVTTWMEPEAQQLLNACAGKNMADNNIYPQTIEIQNRCTAILSKLFNAPADFPPCGTCTIGSSEALMLGGLTMKRKWANKRKENNLPYDKPNMILCSTVQVAWKKFCCYFDVEPRYVNITKDKYVLSPEEAVKLVDENTIGVVAVLGSTYTGHFEPIEELNNALLKLNEEKGFEIGIHVDAASGGFVAPFLYPDLLWDFRLPLVKSINVSCHKYGLVYPGVGWAVWRSKDDLPRDLVFDLHYLGGVEETFTLNFSRPASQMVLQYYNFLRLGREGYTAILRNCRTNADYLTDRIKEMGVFDILSDNKSVPLVAFKLKDNIRGFTVYDIASKLRESGWILPAYSLSENAEDVKLLRAVIRESFSQDLAELLVRSLAQAVAFLKDRAEAMGTHAPTPLAALIAKAHPKVEVKKPEEAKSEEEKPHTPIFYRFFAGLVEKLPRAGESVC